MSNAYFFGIKFHSLTEQLQFQESTLTFPNPWPENDRPNISTNQKYSLHRLTIPTAKKISGLVIGLVIVR